MKPRIKSRERLLIGIAVAALTITLAVLLVDLAREAVAIPVWYLIFVGNLVLGFLPQPLLWSLFLAIVLLIAVKSLTRRRKHAAKGRRKIEVIYPGRVRALLRWIQNADEGVYFKQRLAQHLGKLAVETQAYRERLAPGSIKQRLDNLDAPPEIQAYLQAGLTPFVQPSTGPLALFKRWLRPDTSTSPLDLDPERAVQFLEHQLEATHHPSEVHYEDDPNR